MYSNTNKRSLCCSAKAIKYKFEMCTRVLHTIIVSLKFVASPAREESNTAVPVLKSH